MSLILSHGKDLVPLELVKRGVMFFFFFFFGLVERAEKIFIQTLKNAWRVEKVDFD